MATKLDHSYKIYVIYQGRTITLPVNPEQISISQGSLDSSHEIVNLGEIIIHKGMGLKRVSFTSFFPVHADHAYAHDNPDSYPGISYYVDFFNDIAKYKDTLDKILGDDGICELVISNIQRPEESIVMECVISNFDPEFVAMDDDRYYTLEFTEYQEYHAKLLTLANIANGVAYFQVV